MTPYVTRSNLFVVVGVSAGLFLIVFVLIGVLFVGQINTNRTVSETVAALAEVKNVAVAGYSMAQQAMVSVQGVQAAINEVKGQVAALRTQATQLQADFRDLAYASASALRELQSGQRQMTRALEGVQQMVTQFVSAFNGSSYEVRRLQSQLSDLATQVYLISAWVDYVTSER